MKHILRFWKSSIKMMLNVENWGQRDSTALKMDRLRRPVNLLVGGVRL